VATDPVTKWLKWAAIAVAFIMFVISWCLMTYPCGTDNGD
jgi:hypothetical protein